MEKSKSVVNVDRRFAIIEEWVLDMPVSDRAFRLYALLVRYADKDTHKAWPSRDTLAARLNCHVRSVVRASEELVQAGMLRKTFRKNSSNIYTVITKKPRGGDTAVTPRQGSHEGVTQLSPGGDTGGTLTRVSELESKNDIRKTVKCADDYEPSEKLLASAAEKYPGVNVMSELEQFRDHHMSKGSKFKDWERAFQTWLRNAVKWAPKSKRERNFAKGIDLVAKYKAMEAKEIE